MAGRRILLARFFADSAGHQDRIDSLVDAAHRNGLKVIVDIVLNHRDGADGGGCLALAGSCEKWCRQWCAMDGLF